jgi:hypothetical protein
MKKLIKNLVKALSVSAIACVAMTGCQNEIDGVTPSDWSEGVMATSAWVMAGTGSTISTSSDVLHLAYSEDGLSWTLLTSSAYTSGIGTTHIRDPYIFRMNDGTFVLLAADFTSDGMFYDPGAGEDWNYGNNPSKRIIVAYSDDLVTWNYEHTLTLTDSTGKYGVRYPRAMYNKFDRCYDIYFTWDNGDGVQGIYYVQTEDFLTLKYDDVHTVFSSDHSVGQATVVKGSSNYYLMCRDTRDSDDDVLETKLGGDIQCAKLKTWGDGTFSIMGDADAAIGNKKSNYYVNRGSNQDNVLWQSEPCVYQLASGKWIMLVNYVSSTGYDGQYAAYETENIDDPTSWTDCTSSVTKFSSGRIIGTSVTRITAAELDVLKAAF